MLLKRFCDLLVDNLALYFNKEKMAQLPTFKQIFFVSHALDARIIPINYIGIMLFQNILCETKYKIKMKINHFRIISNSKNIDFAYEKLFKLCDFFMKNRGLEFNSILYQFDCEKIKIVNRFFDSFLHEGNYETTVFAYSKF